jgi:hypothetical protein
VDSCNDVIPEINVVSVGREKDEVTGREESPQVMGSGQVGVATKLFCNFTLKTSTQVACWERKYLLCKNILTHLFGHFLKSILFF